MNKELKIDISQYGFDSVEDFDNFIIRHEELEKRCEVLSERCYNFKNIIESEVPMLQVNKFFEAGKLTPNDMRFLINSPEEINEDCELVISNLFEPEKETLISEDHERIMRLASFISFIGFEKDEADEAIELGLLTEEDVEIIFESRYSEVDELDKRRDELIDRMASYQNAITADISRGFPIDQDILDKYNVLARELYELYEMSTE